MRVGLVVYRDHPSSGGSLSVARTLCRYLPATGVQATLVVSYGAIAPLTHDMGIDALEASLDSKGLRHCRSALRNARFDIIHYIDPAIRIQMIAHDRRAKRLVHVHGRTLLRYVSISDRVLNALLWRSADGVIFISEQGRKDARRHHWVSKQRAWVVRNSVDFDWFSTAQSKESARKKLQLPGRAKLLGIACRLIPHKGVDDAIRVVKRLPPDWHLAIAGAGPFENRLRELTEHLTLEGRVHFLGATFDMRSFYSALDGYLFMSRYEPFGLVTAEAMAAGVPVYGLLGEGEFNEGPQPLLAPDTAFLIHRANPRDFDAPESPERLDLLARTIDATAQRERSEARRRALETIQDFFDPLDQAMTMAKVYRQVVCDSSRP